MSTMVGCEGSSMKTVSHLRVNIEISAGEGEAYMGFQ